MTQESSLNVEMYERFCENNPLECGYVYDPTWPLIKWILLILFGVGVVLFTIYLTKTWSDDEHGRFDPPV